MNILLIGDIVGTQGCDFLRSVLPGFKKLEAIDVVIANGENAAPGNGITSSAAEHIFSSGVDFITTGNHAFRRSEVYHFLDERSDIIRPANVGAACPGKGFGVIDMGRVRIGVINLLGRAYINGSDNPFSCIDSLMEDISDCRIKIVDIHAEATGLLSRRQGDCRCRHAHPCSDCRRKSPARRHGLYNRSRHDGSRALGARSPPRSFDIVAQDGASDAI